MPKTRYSTQKPMQNNLTQENCWGNCSLQRRFLKTAGQIETKFSILNSE